MGKTSKPLNMWVDPTLGISFVTLLEQGHKIVDDPLMADVIFSPVAWRMTPDLLKYLPIAIKAARTVKYPPKKGEKGENESD